MAITVEVGTEAYQVSKAVARHEAHSRRFQWVVGAQPAKLQGSYVLSH